jgi:hypothetical protein
MLVSWLTWPDSWWAIRTFMTVNPVGRRD